MAKLVAEGKHHEAEVARVEGELSHKRRRLDVMGEEARAMAEERGKREREVAELRGEVETVKEQVRGSEMGRRCYVMTAVAVLLSLCVTMDTRRRLAMAWC